VLLESGDAPPAMPTSSGTRASVVPVAWLKLASSTPLDADFALNVLFASTMRLR